MEPEKKIARHDAQKRSYDSMDLQHKKKYLENKAQQYRSMKPEKKIALLKKCSENMNLCHRQKTKKFLTRCN